MPATISGNVALGSASDTFTVAHSTELSTASQTAPDLIVSANISGGTGIGLAKAGAGVLLLSGNNTYAGTTTIGAGTLFISGNNTTSGATTISTGTLITRSANALGGGNNTAGVSVASGQNLTYNAAVNGQLAIGGNLSFAGAGTLGATVGSGSNSSAIDVAGNATTVASNTITVNVYGNTFSTGTGGSGTYTLVQGGGASSLNNATYTLGTVYDNTDFTVGSLTKSSTALQAAVTTVTPLAAAYWKGGLSGATNVWAASNGASQSNWTTDAGGSVATALVPGATTNVIISNSGTVATTPNASNFGADMTINGLTFQTSTAATVNADGYTLTISPASSGAGITLTGAAAFGFNANLAAGAAQTWTNFSGNTFTVNGSVALGGNALAVTGANQTTVVGAISGAGASIVKNGTGTLNFSGSNNFTGGITVNQGTLQLGNPAALGAGTLTLSGAGAALDSSFASLICTTNNPVAVNADFTFNGSQNLNLGTGAVTLGAAAGATGTTRTINVNQNTLTIGGAIGGSGTTQGLAKFGGGTLLFNGQSTYAGPTLISNGTLKIGVSNAVNSGNTVVLSGAPGANDNTTLDLNSFNQAIGTLVMSGVPTNGSNDTSTVTNSNVASPSTLTLTGGASAFYYSYPEYNLPPAAATISVNNLDLNGTPQTFNVVGGANNVTITSVVQDGSLTKTNGGTLFLQGANTYSGTTAIYGGSLQVNNNLGTINQSSAIVIGGGASLVLTNAANQTGVSRVSATAPISSYGGSFQFQNTASAGVAYAQTAGMLTANAGQTDVILNNDQSGTSGASQTLTLSGLAQNGTSVVTFASQPNTNYNNTGLNTSSNVVQVGGVTTATPAGQIIGPWATVGTANSEQRDYAVYNAAGQIVAANGTPTTTDTTWTNASSYYTIGSGTQAQGTTTNITLSANRTMEALRNIGNNDTLTLGAYNLYTYGILHGGQNPFYINSSGGVLSTPTGGGNLYITAGNDWSNPYIQENAPILDNGGAVTVVKSGYQGLYLNGVSTYSGGTVLNAGTTYVNNVNSLGSTASPGTVTFAGGTIDNNSVAGLVFANPLVFNGSGAYGGTGGNSMTFTGPVSLGTAPGAYRSVGVNGGSLVLTGIVSNGTTVNALEKTGNGNLVLDAENMYTGNTILSGGEVQMGVNPVGTAGNVTSSAIGTGAIVFNGGGLASNGVAPRAVLNPVSFNNSSGNQYNAYLGDLASVGKVTFSSTVNLGFAPRGICVNSPVEFDGVVTGSGGVNGGSLVKAGPGLLTLTNASNGYQGPTQVVGGILQPTVAGAIPANTNLLVSSNIGLGTATLDLATNSIPLTVGTLTMGGVTVNNTGPSGNGWSVINTGLATLTLGGDVTYNNTSNPYGATVTGNLALGSLNLVAVSSGTAANWARNFFVNSSGNGQSKPDMTISAAISGPAGVGIYKQSGGMLLLSGNNTYSGATTVNGGSLLITGNNVTTGATAVAGGTLVARSANALGGNANTAVVTVAAGQTFTYNPTSDAQLAIGGNLSIMSTGTVIGVAIGGGTASAAIDVAGAATISGTGSQTINIYGVPGA